MDVPSRNSSKLYLYPPPPVEVEAPARKNPPARPTLDDLLESGLSEDDIRTIFYNRIDAFSTLVLTDYVKGPFSKMHLYLCDVFKAKLGTGAREVIVAPRGAAKSSYTTLALPLWAVCYRKHRFIVIASDTSDQAEDFLSWIKDELEGNDVIRRLYPHAFGKGLVWRNDRIITKNDILIRAMGSGGKIRGRRYKNFRPGLVLCHEKGTPVCYDGTWLPVEELPYKKTEVIQDGVEVKVWSVPFSETVTSEHLYWTKEIKFKINQWDTLVEYDPKWMKAEDLKKNCFIGYPIDKTIVPIQPIDVKKPRLTRVVARDNKGRLLGSECVGDPEFLKEVPPYMNDPDFWWMLGLWWGDGHVSGKNVYGNREQFAMNITINYNDPFVYNRLTEFLTRWNKSWSIQDIRVLGSGMCFQVVFSWSDVARWLVTCWKKDVCKKLPPPWVEQIDPEYQKHLVRGYLDADGFFDRKGASVRLTSIYLEGLLSVRRMLARIGVPASIRKGVGPSVIDFNGGSCNTQQKYDLRFRDGAKLLGYDLEDSSRYSFNRLFIKDGFLWSKVRATEKVSGRVFVPITTPDHTYLTHFGLSHNCDDIENKQMIDSDTMRRGLITWFDQDVCKAGARGQDVDIFVAGTILHKESLLNQLYESQKYANWHALRFQAVESWCSSEEGKKKWVEWKKILTNRFDPLREYEAMRFFLLNKDCMLEGTKILWEGWDTYYALMYEMVTDGELAFFREKQNIPRSPDEQVFRDFYFYTEEEFEPLKGQFAYSLYLDSSIGRQTKKHDFSAIAVIAKHLSSGISFVRQCRINRVPISSQVSDIVQTVLQLNEKNIYPKIGVESNAFQSILGDEIKKKLAEAGARYEKIIQVHHAVDKGSRIESLEPMVKNGTLRFRKYEDQELIEQMEWYPQAGHDDGPDALEGAYTLLNQKVFVPTFARTHNIPVQHIIRDTYSNRKKVSPTYRYD